MTERGSPLGLDEARALYVQLGATDPAVLDADCERVAGLLAATARGDFSGRLPPRLEGRILTAEQEEVLVARLVARLRSFTDQREAAPSRLVWALGKARDPDALEAVLDHALTCGDAIRTYEFVNLVVAVEDLMLALPDLAGQTILDHDLRPLLEQRAAGHDEDERHAASRALDQIARQIDPSIR